MRIVKLYGGLGNQMFQYAFAKALAYRTKEKVLFDVSWFDSTDNKVTDGKSFTKYGADVRELDIEFLPNIQIQKATEKQISRCSKKSHVPSCMRKIFHLPKFLKYMKEKDPFEYDSSLLTEQAFYYEGHFQNPLYFKEVEKDMRYQLAPPPPSFAPRALRSV